MSDTCPYRGDEPYSYVSYAREDRAECLPAIEHLDALGFRVYYEDEVVDEDMLQASSSVIVLVTGCACDSDEVKEEIQLANKSAKDVLAIHLTEVELFGTVGLLLDAADDVKRFRMKESFYRQRLDKALDPDLKRSGVTPPPLPKEAEKVMPPKSKKKDTAAVTASKAGGEAKASAADAGDTGPKPPGLMETLQNLPAQQKAIYGGLAALGGLLLLGLISLVTSAPEAKGPAKVAGAETSEDGPSDTFTAADRKRFEDARRKKQEAERAERQKREQAENAYAAGGALLESGKHAEAIAKYSEAIALRPDQARYFAARAKANYAAKKDADAVRDYSKAIKLDDANTALYLARGRVRQFKDPVRAIKDFSVVIEREPQSAEAFLSRGDAWRRKGTKGEVDKEDLKKAFADYTSSLKIEKSYAGYYGRALVYRKLGYEKKARVEEERARNVGR